jgi:hypothetical protein
VTAVESINDGGEIAGPGMLPNGDFHPIVLLPCDYEHGEREGCQKAAENTDAVAQGDSVAIAQASPNANHRSLTPERLADLRARIVVS